MPALARQNQRVALSTVNGAACLRQCLRQYRRLDRAAFAVMSVQLLRDTQRRQDRRLRLRILLRDLANLVDQET